VLLIQVAAHFVAILSFLEEKNTYPDNSLHIISKVNGSYIMQKKKQTPWP
jgi:hypothetical protein